MSITAYHYYHFSYFYTHVIFFIYNLLERSDTLFKGKCELCNCFNCSYVIKNMIFHGPILNQVGTKPLYKAKNPSFLKVYKNNKICVILLRIKNIYLIFQIIYLYKAIYATTINMRW